MEAASRSSTNSKRKVVVPLRLYGVERKVEGHGIVLVYVVRKTSPCFDFLTWVAGERGEERTTFFLSYLMVGWHMMCLTKRILSPLLILILQKMRRILVCDWTLVLSVPQLLEMGDEQQSTKISKVERICEVDGI